MKIIQAVVDNKIRIPLNKIDKAVLKELKEALTYQNSNYYKLYNMHKSTRGVQKTIRSYTLEKTEITISRGAIYKVREILKRNNYTLQIKDMRILKPYEDFTSNIELRKYQRQCVKQGVFFQNCLLQGGCGSGKTIILLEIITRLKQHTLVVVPTEALLRQWVERAEKFLGIPKKDIGIYGGGKKVIKPLTIGIINSVQKDASLLADKFGAVLVDEVHRSPASTFQEFLDKSKAYYRIGATATPYRKDNMQSLMYDQFGKIAYQIKKEELKRDKILMDVDVIIVPTEFESVEYDLGLIQYNDLLEEIINDPSRNELIEKFVNESYKENHVGLILSDRLQFCHQWQQKLKEDGIDARLLIGGATNKADKKEQEEAIKLLSERKVKLALGTSVADEGLDIPVLDRAFITTPTATNRRRIEQQVGRLERRAEDKDSAKLYYFWDWKVKSISNHINPLSKHLDNVQVFWEGKLITVKEMKKIVRGYYDEKDKQE